MTGRKAVRRCGLWKLALEAAQTRVARCTVADSGEALFYLAWPSATARLRVQEV